MFDVANHAAELLQKETERLQYLSTVRHEEQKYNKNLQSIQREVDLFTKQEPKHRAMNMLYRRCVTTFTLRPPFIARLRFLQDIETLNQMVETGVEIDLNLEPSVEGMSLPGTLKDYLIFYSFGGIGINFNEQVLEGNYIPPAHYKKLIDELSESDDDEDEEDDDD